MVSVAVVIRGLRLLDELVEGLLHKVQKSGRYCSFMLRLVRE